MPARSTLAVAAALVASLALNVRFLVSRPASPPRPAPAAKVAVPVEAEPASGDDGECRRRLAACEQHAWDLVRKVVAGNPKAPPSAPAPEGRGETGPTAQDAALCTKAEATLRETWRRDREVIAAGLALNFADKAEQERNVASEAARMREVAGLDEREAAAVTNAYRERRLARIADARAALGQNPQDFPALLDAARGLYADEDAVLARVAGDAARDAWRAQQLEGRTILLAMTAAMADKDWDDSIHW